MVRLYKDALIQRLKKMKIIGASRWQLNSTLLLIECVSDLQQREHDLVQVSVNRGAGPLHGRALGLDKLIAPLTRVGTAPRVTLTVGVAGSGKSRIVRRFIQLWSSGQIYPELSLAIPIACWELSSFDRLSVERLLRLFIPYDNVDVILFNESCKVLLIWTDWKNFASRWISQMPHPLATLVAKFPCRISLRILYEVTCCQGQRSGFCQSLELVRKFQQDWSTV